MNATLHDTETYNNLLRALDSGMTIYIHDGFGYYVTFGFSIATGEDGPYICLSFGNECYVYPSYNYDPNELYSPTNIPAPDPSPGPSVA